jgi:prolyl-tRNA editing enzyme YbaK/EbsC (Cys-tRNA(Pro) deacylase)
MENESFTPPSPIQPIINQYEECCHVRLSVPLLQMAESANETDVSDENPSTFQNIMRCIMTKISPPVSMMLLRHPSVRTSIEASNQRQVPLHSGAKAMLVCPKNTDQFTLIVLPAHLSCDNKKIASILGIANSKLRMATEDEVRRITGCIPGAVPPFGALFPHPVKTLIDLKMAQSTSHSPPLPFNPQVTLFSKTDPDWPSDLPSFNQTLTVDQQRTDCINFNIGMRTISCSIPSEDYLRILGVDHYFICDISK